MPHSPDGWITTTEAAQRLGVKRATLYAYVSRGLLQSQRRAGQQESLFDRAQIDALASASRPSGSPQPVLRFRSIATTVSSQLDGDLLYRGVPLVDVMALDSVEEAAALVVGSIAAQSLSEGDTPAHQIMRTPEIPCDLRALATGISRVPLERRLPVAVQLLAVADPLAGDIDPDRVRSTALALVPAALSLVAGTLPTTRHTLAGGDLAEHLLRALGGRGGSPAELRLARVLLVSLLDHGLTASTVAARVAASTRAGLHDCLAAAYAAMAGPLHGAAPIAAHALLAPGLDPAVAVGRVVREHRGVAGFGHFLYPDGDPRADLVLEAVWQLPGTRPLRRRVDALSHVVAERTGAKPNIDLASAAALHALDLPAEAGEVVFQAARSFGVAAHVVEEYAEEPLRWRGRDPVT
ncbi:citrate synthase [Humibacillus xanthopallidus]|uniref:citrate synthase (unknown stereospecificity) n=1 Tax=Humibacillus xanthopallidus TaxID=412689 RepID=A0A543PQ08_9MICO|nr:citrate synthase [Humibacillus xanthopallidus]TQN46169.1 citrate synthase [Humibacillus xanthopallidus]